MERRKKGECDTKYVYRPYHPWRHGYRREKIAKWLVRLAKLLLVVEGLVLAGRYIKANTYEKVYKEEIFWTDDCMNEDRESDDAEDGHGGDVFGIGFGAEDGSLFWFHKQTEVVEKGAENDEEK